jgi:uncharacterized protein (DUF2147 family)
MKLLRLTVFLMLATTTGLRAQTTESAIVGRWESDEKDVRMEFFKEGDQYKARLLWGNRVVEADGKTSKKDTQNPDKSLRSRDILGAVTLNGLKWDGKSEYADGKIYDPPSGKTYTCKAWLENDKLHLRGYLGFSLLGKTVVWHRYTGN